MTVPNRRIKRPPTSLDGVEMTPVMVEVVNRKRGGAYWLGRWIFVGLGGTALNAWFLMLILGGIHSYYPAVIHPPYWVSILIILLIRAVVPHRADFSRTVGPKVKP